MDSLLYCYFAIVREIWRLHRCRVKTFPTDLQCSSLRHCHLSPELRVDLLCKVRKEVVLGKEEGLGEVDFWTETLLSRGRH